MSISPRTSTLGKGLAEDLVKLLPVEDVDSVAGLARKENVAAIRLRDGFLVIGSSSLAISGKQVGYLVAHLAANNVAVKGATPKWFLPTIFLPSRFSEEEVRELFDGIAQALRELGGVAVGGRVEITLNAVRPLISVTAVGYTTSRVILASGARVGDLVYVVGEVGGAGASVIAWNFEAKLLEEGVDQGTINEAKALLRRISSVDTAIRAKGYVSTMCDAGEGGILQALHEIAVASRVSITVQRDKVELREPVKLVVNHLKIDPLKLLSSGCIVVTVPASRRKEFENFVEKTAKPYSLIGVVVEGDGEVIVKENVATEVIKENVVDEIYKLWW